VFLYAAQHARALETGVFSDTTELPRGDVFYPVYLARLREQVGPELFQTVYLPLLLHLTAAFEPVTREQLERWGLPSDRVRVALNDLRDYVLVVRARLWHEGLNESGEQRYELAHEDFERFVQRDSKLAELLRGCHERMAARALDRGRGQWETFDPADDADLYDMRFVGRHAQEARRSDWIDEVGRSEEYARGCWRVADLLQTKARHVLAVELFGRIEEVYRRLADQEGCPDLDNNLAGALVNRGVAKAQLGQPLEAVADFDQAIAILERLVGQVAGQEGPVEWVENLAGALLNRGSALISLGRRVEAAADCDQAIEILRWLVEQEGCLELSNDLAGVLMNRGMTLEDLHRLKEAQAAYDQAIAIRRRLVEQEGRHELANDLATALVNRGNVLDSLGGLEEAMVAYDQALAIRRRLAEQEGRLELASDLAGALINRGNTLERLGRLQEAMVACDEAIAVLQRLVEQEGCHELACDLAFARAVKANAQLRLGERERAAELARQAVTDLRAEVERTRRADLSRFLTFAEGVLHNAEVDPGA
jgi:tetratricopeptide (TPR) repeat protein